MHARGQTIDRSIKSARVAWGWAESRWKSLDQSINHSSLRMYMADERRLPIPSSSHAHLQILIPTGQQAGAGAMAAPANATLEQYKNSVMPRPEAPRVRFL